jgi:hypothetical protein
MWLIDCVPFRWLPCSRRGLCSFANILFFCLFYYHKVVHRVAVGLLKKFQTEILSSDFEGIMDLLQHNIPNLVDPEDIMKVAFGLRIKKAYIDAIQREYRENMLDHRAAR